MENGDDASTLASQYGLEQDVADRLFSKMEDGAISGQAVIDADPYGSKDSSEILKLDLTSEMATDQRVFDQFKFASDYTYSKGEFDFRPSEFYKNRPIRLSPTSGNAKLNGIDISYEITLYNSNKYSNWSKTNEFPISNYIDETQQTGGMKNDSVFFFYRISNSGKPARSDGAKIYFSGNENYNSIYNRFNRR